MQNVPIEDAGQRLPELAQRVERGETIVVTRDGVPVLDLVPHQRTGAFDPEAVKAFKRRHGIEKIVTYIAADFDDPLPEDFLVAPTPSDKPGT